MCFFAAVKETKNASVRKARQGRKTGYRRRVSKNIRCGAALVLAEDGLDGKKLFAAAAAVLKDERKLAEMSRNMAALGVRDSTQRIYACVTELLR